MLKQAQINGFLARLEDIGWGEDMVKQAYSADQIKGMADKAKNPKLQAALRKIHGKASSGQPGHLIKKMTDAARSAHAPSTLGGPKGVGLYK